MTAFVNLFPQLPLSAATNLNDSRSLLWRRRSCVQRNGSFSRGVWRAQLHATTLPKSSNNGSLVKDQSAIRLIACDMVRQ